MKFFKKTSEYLVEYDNGDQYRGEVNEDMEPHGRGVLKSKSEAILKLLEDCLKMEFCTKQLFLRYIILKKTKIAR